MRIEGLFFNHLDIFGSFVRNSIDVKCHSEVLVHEGIFMNFGVFKVMGQVR
jgi:hypothetical protein